MGEKLVLVPSIHMKGFSGDYADYYFGVTSEEAGRKGNYNLRDEYKADTAFSYGATLTAEYKMSEKLSLIGIVGVEKFSDEITDSPIVNDEPIVLASIGAKYFF